MKTLTVIFLILFALAGMVSNSAAVSPMPMEELKVGPSQTVCIIHLVHIPEHGKEIVGLETTSTLVFNPTVLKSDVLEKAKNYINLKLNEENISEFKVECTFPKQ
jgi:hypothetical protein